VEPTKTVLETGYLFEQMDRIHDSIARRAFEIFLSNGKRRVMTSRIGSRPNPNACTR
jgi:hypothetical protein